LNAAHPTPSPRPSIFPSSLRISCTEEPQRSTCRQAICLDVFEGEDDSYGPARHQAEINANASPALLDAFRSAVAFEKVDRGRVIPAPESYHDIPSETHNRRGEWVTRRCGRRGARLFDFSDVVRYNKVEMVG
jgi:hypothetical protein